MKETIIIIGAAGAGKTTVGRALAKLIDRPFFDTDEMVEAACGKTIPELFSSFGEKHFRALECEAVKNAAQAAIRTGAGAIIAVGGGAVADKANAAVLLSAGRIVWLERDIKLVAREGRPLYKEAGAAERLLLERTPIYSSLASMRVQNNSTIDAAVAAFHNLFT